MMPAAGLGATPASQAQTPISAPADAIPASPAPTSAAPANPAPAAPVVPADMEALRQKLVSGFETTKNMLAVGLQQTSNWTDGGEVVSFTVGTQFTYNYLEQEHKTIAAAASRLLGRQMDVSIALKEAEEADPDGQGNEIPPMVEALRQMFRGTLVGEDTRK